MDGLKPTCKSYGWSSLGGHTPGLCKALGSVLTLQAKQQVGNRTPWGCQGLDQDNVASVSSVESEVHLLKGTWESCQKRTRPQVSKTPSSASLISTFHKSGLGGFVDVISILSVCKLKQGGGWLQGEQPREKAGKGQIPALLINSLLLFPLCCSSVLCTQGRRTWDYGAIAQHPRPLAFLCQNCNRSSANSVPSPEH